MGSRKGIVYETIQRFDSLMAIGESRREAKQAMREATGIRTWSISDGKIHSHGTRKDYQKQVLVFVNWVRTNYQIHRLEQLDARTEELVSCYLHHQMVNGASAYTVKAERSAFRLFFGNPKLARSVRLKKRKREAITQSRGIAKHDKHFQPANWQSHIRFALATGLRRSELRDLRIRDIFYDHDGTLMVHVVNGKGGREREVCVLPGKEEDVLAVIVGRDPDQHVFKSIPKHMDVHSYRRLFAQALYLCHAPGWELPPATGRLKPSDYNRPAAEKVSMALGHSRVSVVLRHYIR